MTQSMLNATHSVKGVLRVEFAGDSIEEYFTKLKEHMDTEKPEMLNSLMTTIVGFPFSPMGGYVAPRMGKWNPYLYSTGQDREYWEGEITDAESYLQAMWTGRDINHFFSGGLPKGIWWEFATEDSWGKPAREKKLERDYAWYQETGQDPIAKPSDAKHKGAIRRGIIASKDEVLRDAQDYLNRIIELQKVKTVRTDKRSVTDMFK